MTLFFSVFVIHNGDFVTILRSNADGGHGFIGSDGRSTFVWNIQPLTSLSASCRASYLLLLPHLHLSLFLYPLLFSPQCVNHKSGV